MKGVYFFAYCIIWLPVFLTAQSSIIWGGPDNPNSTFDGGLNDWTDDSGDSLAVWVWDEEGAADQGAYTTITDIQSATPENGAAVFDSDFYDNAGIPMNFCGALGTPVIGCAPQLGVLTSPIIDLSDTDGGQLAVRFHQYYRNFMSTCSIAYSNDGGTTWIDTIVVNTEIGLNESTPADDVQLIELPGAGGTDQFRFRFIFDANYYFWIIDDVQIVGSQASDLEITDYFYPASYAVTPMSQIAIDTFDFKATIYNHSIVPATDVMLTAEVRNIDTDPATVLHSQTVDLETLAPNDSLVAGFDLFDSYIPDLEVGIYDVRYSVTSSNGNELSPDNNVAGNTFAVSDHRYAMSINGSTTFSRPSMTQNYLAANLYRTAAYNDFSNTYVATQVLFEAAVLTSEIDSIPDTELPVYLFKVLPGWNETLDPVDPLEVHPHLTPLAIVEMPFSVADADTTYIVDLIDLNGNVGVVLEPNSTYMVGVQYYGMDKLILQGANLKRKFPSMPSLIWFDLIEQWGRFSPKHGLTIELNIEQGSNTKNLLPESTFAVLPNPTSDLITATIKLENASRATVRVFDMMGRVIETRNFANLTSEQVQFDVSQYANGTYTLHLTTEEGISTQKFVVNH